MQTAFLILSWILSVPFGVLAASMFLTGNTLQAILLVGVFVLLLPPTRNLIQQLIGRPIPGWALALLIIALLLMFVLLVSRNKASSIYLTPEHEAALMERYDARLAAWPVPYETQYVDTAYGKVHVILSGPENAPPLLLLHASGVSGVSWLENIDGLSKHYRTYAIDTIGDVGRSQLANVSSYPADSKALGEWVGEVADELGVKAASVVGASQGGLIATSYALHAPQRVDRVVLLGPMGYAGTNASVARILLATMFPVRPLQEDTVTWAFGDDPAVLEAYGQWLLTVMDGVASKQARPTRFSSEQLDSLQVPVLLVLGTKDNLVGDPDHARRLVEHVPHISVETINTGHLLGVERPEEVNQLILGFLGAGQ